ncbi:hypothetical protein EVAR_76661_1 [Eumeta japonica]|uniref:Uncharacterized protein n=1 Tax=Eumeta variegata TaxID=151549 RepID=A0A4C1YHT1_EUMVA|nr:hypothetical protein EVAR_76661_1 [Eumeta japonica]
MQFFGYNYNSAYNYKNEDVRSTENNANYLSRAATSSGAARAAAAGYAGVERAGYVNFIFRTLFSKRFSSHFGTINMTAAAQQTRRPAAACLVRAQLQPAPKCKTARRS